MTDQHDILRPNQPKAMPVIALILLMPIIMPAYVFGILFALLRISAYCGYANSEKYFMNGLGFEPTEQTVLRMIKREMQ